MEEAAYHFGETSRREDVAGVDEPIEKACRRLDRLPHVVVQLFLSYRTEKQTYQ
jgi:hypothetical protein